ncbi:MAG TPA: MFS transporter [Pseudonocardia sp.]|jgi:sugar phosphate permease
MTSSRTAPLSHRRWVVLALGVLAQASACSFVYGIPFLVPALRDARHLSLAEAGVYVAGPTLGLLLTLIAWGAAADRWGERVVITSGLALAAVAIGAAGSVDHAARHPSTAAMVALLAVAGAMCGAVFAASGRMVMGWFPVGERGTAMGIRQTSQPLGVAIAGACLPALAGGEVPFRALLLPSALCLLSAVLVGAFAPDPPRAAAGPGAARPRSPYRAPVLWRVHGASALLVAPQFAISAFAAEYLVRELGWSAAAAGAYVAVTQVAGAAGRIVSGWWSDRVRSRLRPMRQLAVAATGVLLLFALGALVAPWLAVAALALGGVITVADNGLAYTSVAEIAGPAWSGRALGAQNTGQNVVTTLAPVVLGAVIGAHGYSLGFTLAALAPLLAVVVTPVRSEPASRW